jgi:hypothetical protein
MAPPRRPTIVQSLVCRVVFAFAAFSASRSLPGVLARALQVGVGLLLVVLSVLAVVRLRAGDLLRQKRRDRRRDRWADYRPW